jgi:hypothetical protein
MPILHPSAGRARPSSKTLPLCAAAAAAARLLLDRQTPPPPPEPNWLAGWLAGLDGACVGVCVQKSGQSALLVWCQECQCVKGPAKALRSEQGKYVAASIDRSASSSSSGRVSRGSGHPATTKRQTPPAARTTARARDHTLKTSAQTPPPLVRLGPLAPQAAAANFPLPRD